MFGTLRPHFGGTLDVEGVWVSNEAGASYQPEKQKLPHRILSWDPAPFYIGLSNYSIFERSKVSTIGFVDPLSHISS